MSKTSKDNTTALARSCYFYALKHTEPAVVNTLHSGLAPLTVIAMSAAGWRLAGKQNVGRLEALCHIGLGLTLLGLWWAVLAGHAALTAVPLMTRITSLAAVLVSGTAITISLLLSKRLNEAGIGSDAVTAVRYIAMVLLSAALVGFSDAPTGVANMTHLLALGGAGFALIVLPLYILQLGIARTGPLTATVFRALGPVFVFALEQFDRRITFSTVSLILILLYSFFALAGSIAHGWRKG